MKIRYSALVEAGFGRDGNLVIRDSRYGPIAVKRSVPGGTPSEGQKKSRVYLGQSAKAYSGLNASQISAWEDYAKGIVRKDPVTLRSYSPTGISLRVELGSRFLKMSPGGTLPSLPPTSGFAGDSLTFEVQAVTGALIVLGSGATSAGCVLEVQTLRLKSAARKPGKTGYVSQGFFALEAGQGFEAEVPLPAGIYAVQVRYLRTATGQATAWQPLGKATVALSLVEGGADEAVEPVSKPARAKKAA